MRELPFRQGLENFKKCRPKNNHTTIAGQVHTGGARPTKRASRDVPLSDNLTTLFKASRRHRSTKQSSFVQALSLDNIHGTGIAAARGPARNGCCNAQRGSRNENGSVPQVSGAGVCRSTHHCAGRNNEVSRPTVLLEGKLREVLCATGIEPG